MFQGKAASCLIFAFTLLIASIKISTSMTMAKPGCRETCGNLTIPYPFGIGPGCYYGPGFDVSCEDNHTFMHNSSSQMEIYNISLLRGQARVNTLIASKCYGSNTSGWTSTNTAPLFTLSSKANKLTAVGCNTLAFLGGYNGYRAETGCFAMCFDKQSVDRSGQCSGMGCCQTSIAPNLTNFNITFDERYNNSEVHEFNQCSYAFVAEQEWFKFEASYIEDNKLIEKYKDGVPAVLDWVAGRTSYVAAGRDFQATLIWKMGAKVRYSLEFTLLFKIHPKLPMFLSFWDSQHRSKKRNLQTRWSFRKS